MSRPVHRLHVLGAQLLSTGHWCHLCLLPSAMWIELTIATDRVDGVRPMPIYHCPNHDQEDR